MTKHNTYYRFIIKNIRLKSTNFLFVLLMKFLTYIYKCHKSTLQGQIKIAIFSKLSLHIIQ